MMILTSPEQEVMGFLEATLSFSLYTRGRKTAAVETGPGKSGPLTNAVAAFKFAL